MGKAEEFAAEVKGAGLRRKIAKKRKVLRKPKKLFVAEDQTRLKAIKVTAKMLEREEIYKRNMKLAEESSRYDEMMHLRRIKK